MIEIKIFISHSPRDTREECKIIKDIIKQESKIRFEIEGFILRPICWKDVDRGKGDPQEDYIDPIIIDSHLVIMVLWSFWGNPTTQYSSGIEHEYELIKKHELECLIFFSNQPLLPSKIIPNQLKQIQEFQRKIENERKYAHCGFYQDLDDFKVKFRNFFIPKITKITREVEIKTEFNPTIRGF